MERKISESGKPFYEIKKESQPTVGYDPFSLFVVFLFILLCKVSTYNWELAEWQKN